MSNIKSVTALNKSRLSEFNRCDPETVNVDQETSLSYVSRDVTKPNYLHGFSYFIFNLLKRIKSEFAQSVSIPLLCGVISSLILFLIML